MHQYLRDSESLAIESALDRLTLEFQSIAASRKKKGASSLRTVGIEHEFFLFSSAGPSTREESNEFMRAVVETKGFALWDGTEEEPLSVSKEMKEQRYLKLKYEYSPHILELSLPYFESLYDLKSSLVEIFSVLEEVASRLDLRLVSTGFIPFDASLIAGGFDRDVHSSRIMNCKARGIEDSRILHFPSYTAATQIQIGRFEWEKEPLSLLERVYHFDVQSIGSELRNKFYGSEYRKRVSLYRSAYNDQNAAVPNTKKLNEKSWIEGALSNPLLEGSGETGLSVILSGKSIRFQDVRDVQFIRPRTIGTIEFRGHSARRNIEDILKLAALKLASVELAISTNLEVVHENTYRIWEKHLNGDGPRESFEEYVESLSRRGLGEERFLCL